LKQWRHDLQAMADTITDRTRLLFLCNPNNPTGSMVSADEVELLLSRVPAHVVVVCDEAYFEYVRDPHFPDSMAYVKQGRNVIVLRTFSKIYGLAGLRIGYGVATAEITNILNRVRPPFNANSLAQRAALAALDDDEHVARSRAVNEAGMAQMVKGLTVLGFAPIPSEANFVYVDVGRDGRTVFEALLREGIIVRHIEGHMVRVTIGLEEENREFLAALKRVIHPH
jgi:histidinol-phosphate aminotransferase